MTSKYSCTHDIDLPRRGRNKIATRGRETGSLGQWSRGKGKGDFARTEILRWQRVRVVADKIESMLVCKLQLCRVCSKTSVSFMLGEQRWSRASTRGQELEVLTDTLLTRRRDRHRIDGIVTVPSKKQPLPIEHQLVAIDDHRAHAEARGGGVKRCTRRAEVNHSGVERARLWRPQLGLRDVRW